MTDKFAWNTDEVEIVKYPPPVEESNRFVWKPGDITVIPPAKEGEVVFTIDKNLDEVFDFYKKAAKKNDQNP
jgi:hypothetical protein